MSRDEYIFVRDNRKNVNSVSLLVEILDVIRRDYFHYKDPISLSVLNTFVSETINTHYRKFYINKRNGKKRCIATPDKRLKEIQDCIRILLAGIRYHGESVVANAKPHIGKDIVYNMDIKDFYGSINAVQIINSLLKLKFSYDAALLVSFLVTIRSGNGLPVLPQGAPSSPIIAEIVVKDLDSKLYKCAKKYDCEYSRYADDITFSGSASCLWRVVAKEFSEIIFNYGFSLNKKKRRVSFYYQRQEVTGLTVNKHLNVPRTFIKRLRTIIHNWEMDGYIVASNKFYMYYYKNLINPKRSIPQMEQVVAEQLSYLKMVRQDNKNTVDPLWQKLHKRYEILLTRDAKIIRKNH